MTSKARFEAERQKQRILLESVFGIWTDVRKTIRVRITPVRNSVRIRIVEILDKTIIDSIVYFCGLNATPKRSNWANFDLVTDLMKHWDSNSFGFGAVHLPHATRRIKASLVILNKSQVQLNFFTYGNNLPEICTGSITFSKDQEWHNRDDRKKRTV